VKEDVMLSTPIKKIDVLQISEQSNDKYVNLMHAKKIDLGYATRNALSSSKDIVEKDILEFRQDCRMCLQNFVAKMLQKVLSSQRHTSAHSVLRMRERRTVLSIRDKTRLIAALPGAPK